MRDIDVGRAIEEPLVLVPVREMDDEDEEGGGEEEEEEEEEGSLGF